MQGLLPLLILPYLLLFFIHPQFSSPSFYYSSDFSFLTSSLSVSSLTLLSFLFPLLIYTQSFSSSSSRFSLSFPSLSETFSVSYIHTPSFLSPPLFLPSVCLFLCRSPCGEERRHMLELSCLSRRHVADWGQGWRLSVNTRWLMPVFTSACHNSPFLSPH